MEKGLNGVLPLGISKYSHSVLTSCAEGKGVEVSSPEDGLPVRLYDDAYQGYLGYGYNVIDKRYYNSLDISMGAPILRRQLKNEKPHLKIRVDKGTYVETTNIAALYADEYSQKVSAGVGLGVQSGAFKANFDMAFTNEKKVSASKSFATRRNEITLRREYFDLSEITESDLKTYLSDSFRIAVNEPTVSAEKLFERYGTHLLLDVRLGGRMELDFMHEKSSNETEQSLTTSLEASYMAITSNASVDYKKAARAFFDSSSFHCVLIGGAVSTDISTMEHAQVAYDKWSKSLDPAVTHDPSLAFIGTGSLNNPASVIPVWSLADAVDRQKTLKAGFMDLLATNGAYFKNLQDKVLTSYVKNLFVGHGDSPDAAKSDVYAQMSTYDQGAPQFIVQKDLNSSAGGRYVYLGYTTTTDINDAIRGVRGMTDSNDANCQSIYYVNGCTYHQIHRDLNSGARGHFVYLYWTKDAAAGKPLLAADVEINYSGICYGETGWKRVRLMYDNGDLNANRGTGGRTYDIFVWVKQDHT